MVFGVCFPINLRPPPTSNFLMKRARSIVCLLLPIIRSEFPSWLAWKILDTLFTLLIFQLARSRLGKRFLLADKFELLGWE